MVELLWECNGSTCLLRSRNGYRSLMTEQNIFSRGQILLQISTKFTVCNENMQILGMEKYVHEKYTNCITMKQKSSVLHITKYVCHLNLFEIENP